MCRNWDQIAGIGIESLVPILNIIIMAGEDSTQQRFVHADVTVTSDLLAPVKFAERKLLFYFPGYSFLKADVTTCG